MNEVHTDHREAHGGRGPFEVPGGLVETDPASLLGYESPRELPEATDTEKLVLKYGNLFAVTNRIGDIWPAGARDLGAYFDDTRMLSAWRLHLAGAPAVVLSSHQSRAGRSQVDLTVTSTNFGGVFEVGDPTNFVHLRREQVVHELFAERLTLTNYLVRPVDYWFELEFACDFADVFEVRGFAREGRGTYYEPVLDGDAVRLCYLGRDGVFYEVRLECSPAPTRLTGHRVRFELSLEPNASATVELRLLPRVRTPHGHGEHRRARLVWPPEGVWYPGTRTHEPPAPLAFDRRVAALRSVEDAWKHDCTRLVTSDQFATAMLEEAVIDLRALVADCAGMPVVAAGIPWYTAPFGRDALLTSFLSLVVTPDLARDALDFLATFQGESHDRFREEAPGKILHEVRRGEMARAGEVPHAPYYGSVDATPLFVVLLHEYYVWTGDEATVLRLLPRAEEALAWVQGAGDPDGDGFLEYRRLTDKGLRNQGWKDSTDGVPFPDGLRCEPPIALVEVQGYAVDAERRLGDLYRRLGDDARADALQAKAAERMRRLERAFWAEDVGTFGLALDRDKRLARTVTSNAGHLLFSEAVTPARAAQVARSLLGPSMWSGWGIRTLATGQPAYNPLSYHNGTIWPHDNALIAQGFANYRLMAQAGQVLTALMDTARHFEEGRLPELFCGLEREPLGFPVSYPVACVPQAWASAAVIGTLRASLGLFPDAPRRRLRIVKPHLPAALERVELRNLRIGGTRLDLRFERAGDGVFASVLRRQGEAIEVNIEL